MTLQARPSVGTEARRAKVAAFAKAPARQAAGPASTFTTNDNLVIHDVGNPTGAAIVEPMARYTLVYGLRLIPEGTLAGTEDVRLKTTSGELTGLTLHTIDGTIPQLRRALDRSLDAFFEFLPGVSDEDRREFDDS